MACREGKLMQIFKGQPVEVLGGMQYGVAFLLGEAEQETVERYPVACVVVDGGGNL